jgi:hypothetical protein
MAWEEYCAACTYMKEEQYYGKYWCERKGEYRPANDARCGSYCEAYRRSNTSRENMLSYSKNYGSGCYLTTIMCNLLGYDDNNYYLNTLRKFRDNVMQKNPAYLPLLLTYDDVGPIISERLANDPDAKEIAISFFNNYIPRAVVAIEENKEQTAINIYTVMTQALADKYNINIPTMKVNCKEIDPKTLGHGYSRVRKPNFNI